jgi:nicotinate phosphoribosyltransferase
LQVRRYLDKDRYSFDMIYDMHTEFTEAHCLDLLDPTRVHQAKKGMTYRDLLVPVMRQGKRVYGSPSLSSIRSRTLEELNRFPPTMRRFLNPERYFVGLEKALYDRKLQLIRHMRT